jgi:hypothetical protein
MFEEVLYHGHKVSPAGRRLQIADPGRVCSEPSCATVLSRYNTAQTCHIHRPVRFPRIRGVNEAGRSLVEAPR